MLHRWIRKLLDKLLSLETSKKIAEKIQLRKEVHDICRFLVQRRIFHNAYYAFNGIIALGQFINLGFGLLAITSSLHSLVAPMYGGAERALQKEAPKVEKGPIAEEDDLGEEITNGADRGLHGSTLGSEQMRERIDLKPEKTPRTESKEERGREGKKEKSKRNKTKEKKVKKTKKPRSAIDEIFG